MLTSERKRLPKRMADYGTSMARPAPKDVHNTSHRAPLA